jgi:hypothetical protein
VILINVEVIGKSIDFVFKTNLSGSVWFGTYAIQSNQERFNCRDTSKDCSDTGLFVLIKENEEQHNTLLRWLSIQFHKVCPKN